MKKIYLVLLMFVILFPYHVFGQDWINVKDAPYNAVGNGSADDTLAIIAALEDLNTSCSTLFFPEGTYIFSGIRIGDFTGVSNPGNIPVISGTNGIRIIGANKYKTTIKLKNNANTDLFVFRYLSNIEFRNITLDGNKANNINPSYCYFNMFTPGENCNLLIRDGSNMTCESVITKNTHFGICFSSDAKNQRVVNCDMTNCVFGCDMQGQNIIIENNYLDNNTHGIRLEGENRDLNMTTFYASVAHAQIKNNVVTNCTGAGIRATGMTYDLLIEGNQVQNCLQWGIVTDFSDLTGERVAKKIKIVNNEVYGSTDASIGEGIEAINKTEGVQISGNTVDNCNWGLYLYSLNKLTVNENIVTNNKNSGIYIYNTPSTVISGNIACNNNQDLSSGWLNGAGLLLQNCNNSIVNGNNFSDDQTTHTQRYGLGTMNCSNVIITNNIMLGNVHYSYADYDNTTTFTMDRNLWDSLCNNVTTSLFPTIGQYSFDGKKVTYGTSYPSSGTWSTGDRCINTNPTEQGLPGSKYIIEYWVYNGSSWIQERVLTGN